MHKGDAVPLVGGAAARNVPAVLAGAARVAAWGEPARPGFSPEGKRERGESDSLRRRLIPNFMSRSPELPWCASSGDRTSERAHDAAAVVDVTAYDRPVRSAANVHYFRRQCAGCNTSQK